MDTHSPVEFFVLLNLDPHILKLSFDVPYSRITVVDVIKKVDAFLQETFALVEHKPRARFLRYIHDQRMGFDPTLYSDKGAVARRLCLTSAHAVSQLVEGQAYLWYRSQGHHLSTRLLDPESTLEASSIFNPVNAQRVQLYVLTPDVVNPQQYWPSYQQDQRQLVARQSYIDKMQEDLLNRMGENGVDPPSTACQSTLKLDRVQASKTPISIGYRPWEDFGPLPALFCAPFAYAHNRASHLDSVQVEDGEFITRLWLSHFADDLGAINRGECQLVDKVHESLQELIEDDLVPYPTSTDAIGPVSDLDLVAKCRTAHDLEVNYFIFELRNGAFSGGSASLQGILSYQRMIALEKNDGVVKKTCYPCMIMGVTATDVHVSLAYFSDRVCATKLFYISLTQPQNNAYKIRKLAPAFQILRNTARMLRQWYADVHTGASLPDAPFLFPQPEAIISHHVHIPPPGPHHIDISSLNLRFIAKFVPSTSPNCCLYQGVMVHKDRNRPPAPVYIKFVPSTYGEQPHRLLAQHGLAPKLHYCAEVVDGLTMIVMDDLRGSHLPASYGKAFIDIFNKRISRAVTLLHGNNFVHGDLRPQNVVLDQTNQAFLIDFDWAGVAGVARYPDRLNPKITWPRPLVEMEGRLIHKDDDRFMLQRLLNPPPRKSVTSRETSKRPRDEDDAHECDEEGRPSGKKSKREPGSGKHLGSTNRSDMDALSVASSDTRR